MHGRIIGIQVRPGRDLPTRAVESARAEPGSGLEGDHARAGKREITILSREAWDAACRDAGCEGADPRGRRANVIVEGVELSARIGARLRLGGCVVQVEGETLPCDVMEGVHAGLRAALGPDTRGGVHGRIVAGATLRVGDGVSWIEP